MTRSASRGQPTVDQDTDLGGAAAAFPITRCSLVRAASSADAGIRKQAQETLIAAYWKPVYKYIRFKWGMPNEDAKDLTQAFFARALEKDFFDCFDSTRARFRTFVRVCVEGFVGKEHRAAGRLKRGGGIVQVSLDFAGADEELTRHAPAAGSDPDVFFRREWLRGLFALAVDDLRQACEVSGKRVHFALFERYDLEGPDAPEHLTYAALGEQFGLPATQVTNYLASARRQFRELLLDRLRASTGSEEEYQYELRCLFGGEAP
jgi:RNA polymerase sigma factor (sigma-70 family)